MKVAIMQPYFMPYVGYFQLIGAVDLFVVYDNIKYTKKGWINRNRMLLNDTDVMFSLPIKSASDSLDVRDRVLAADFDRDKLLRQIGAAYRRAPYYTETMALMGRILACTDSNLFGFLHQSLLETCRHLGISTNIVVSSDLDVDPGLKGQEMVLAYCRAAGARTYVNPIGGMALYGREQFAAHGIALRFLQSRALTYAQFGSDFVPWLSIVDVLMFNPPETLANYVHSGYELI
jgi:hypothetical protein